MCWNLPIGRPNAERLRQYSIVVLERELRRGHGADGDGHPLADQVLDEVDEALALLAEQVGRRHPDIVKNSSAVSCALQADLVEVAAALETGNAALDARAG